MEKKGREENRIRRNHCMRIQYRRDGSKNFTVLPGTRQTRFVRLLSLWNTPKFSAVFKFAYLNSMRNVIMCTTSSFVLIKHNKVGTGRKIINVLLIRN